MMLHRSLATVVALLTAVELLMSAPSWSAAGAPTVVHLGGRSSRVATDDDDPSQHVDYRRRFPSQPLVIDGIARRRRLDERKRNDEQQQRLESFSGAVPAEEIDGIEASCAGGGECPSAQGRDSIDMSLARPAYFDVEGAQTVRRHAFHALQDNYTDCRLEAVPCSGHGTCSHDGLVCTCFHSDVTGYWTGGSCADCDAGYAGSDCKTQCAGGFCSPCNNNGICNAGILGDGSCRCYLTNTQGYWTGPACSICATGHFGVDCTQTCPGSDVGPACYGRGTCDMNSNGRCTCIPGYSSVSGCRDCDAAHYGPGCSKTCPGSVGDVPCSGHGVCFNGTNGNGSCVCTPGSNYGTPTCGTQCPNDCSGFGYCNAGAQNDASCTCNPGYAPPNCSRCVTDRTGPGCTDPCPKYKQNVCADHGTCYYDSVTQSAACNCVPGYGGVFCELACPGNPPCSGHGSCNWAAEPFCVCDQDAVHGYWTGPTCSICTPSYNNSMNNSCQIRCPVGSNGLICSGKGQCFAGVCYCTRTRFMDYCGVDCSVASLPFAQTANAVNCSCVYCSDLNKIGSTCQTYCPGTSTSGVVCSGHGVCKEGVREGFLPAGQCNGVMDIVTSATACICNWGYTNYDCSMTCVFNPGSETPETACGGIGRGQCVADTINGIFAVRCKCIYGYMGTSCEKTCPMINGMVCNGQGLCRTDINGDPYCECNRAFTGPDCDVPCLCGQTGRCDPTKCNNYTSYQSCTACLCAGNYTASSGCVDCISQTQGPTCSGSCVNGVTVGKICQCFTNWSTPSCTVPCPIDNRTGLVCGGHGRCDWGFDRLGTCICDAEYFGATCSTFCTIGICLNTLANPQCNALTGQCECLASPQGYWTGTKCDVCSAGYWGPSCNEACLCNGHGSCDQNTGVCNCFTSTIDGFYAGQQCDRCADGYIGEQCQRRNVLITRVQRNQTNFQSVPTQLPPPGSPSWSLPDASLLQVDYRAGYLYAGYPTSQLDVSHADVVYRRTTMGPGSVLASNDSNCPMVPFTTWTYRETQYYLLQPCPAVAGYRIVSTPAGKLTSPLIYTTVVAENFTSFMPNASNLRIVRASVLTTQAGPTDPISIPHVVSFVVAPVPAGVPTSQAPGGALICIEMDASPIARFWAPLDFLVRDVAISRSAYPVSIAVSGSNTGRYELHLYTLYSERIVAAFIGRLPTPSIVDLLLCWPGSLTNQVGAGPCPDCISIDQVRFYNGDLVVAVSTSTMSFVAYIQKIINLKDFIFYAPVRGVCTLVRSQGNLVVLVSDGSPTATPDFGIRAASAYEVQVVATAMIIDTEAGVAFVCLAPTDGTLRAAVVAKFLLTNKLSLLSGSDRIPNGNNFQVYGKRYLDFVSSADLTIIPEVFTALAIDSSARLLYGLVRGINTLRVVTFVMYEVHSVSPDVADQRGGTMINITGLGFRVLQNISTGTTLFPVYCYFGGSERVLAEQQNNIQFTSILCRSPPVDNLTNAVGSCDGQTVEVSLYGNRWPTQNGIAVQRIQSAKLDSVTPDRGQLSGTLVTIFGQGFVDSSFATCRFFSNFSSSTESQTSPVTFLSTNAVSCQQPRFFDALPDTSLVDIASDGQLFTTGGPIPYLVVGDAGNVSCPLVTKVTSDFITPFSIITSIVDSQGHQLRALDTVSRRICLQNTSIVQSLCDVNTFSWRSPTDEYPWPPCRNNTLGFSSPGLGWCRYTTAGVLPFSDLFLTIPRSGNLLLPFIAPDSGWTRWATVTVMEGVGYALAIGNRVDLTTPIINGQTYSPAPEIIVIDKLANILSQSKGIAINASTYYIIDGKDVSDPANEKPWTFYSLTQRPDSNSVHFSQLFLKYWHGANHYVRFSSLGLKSTTTPPIRTILCDGGGLNYKVVDSSECLSCPPNGKCNGTEIVEVPPGFWRAEGVVAYIEACPGGRDVCPGSQNLTGAPCEYGYEGPLCQLCIANYGHSSATQCLPCDSTAKTVGYIVGGAIAVLTALLVWVVVTLRTAETTDASVIFRTVINHMQATGKLGEISTKWSPFLQSVFVFQNSGSSLAVTGFASVDCLLRTYNLNYSTIFIIYMCLPVISFVMAVGVFGVVRIAKLEPVISSKLLEEIETELKSNPNAKIGQLKTRYPLYMIVITTFCVSMFTLYQTLITQSTSVLQCQPIQLASRQWKYYLKVDYSIECTSASEHAFSTVALVCAIGYGFGIPIAFVFGYKLINGRVATVELTKLMFMFLIGGYKEEFWYWQAVIMIRKMILVCIIVFIGVDTNLQSYCGMWTMSAALVMQIWFQPNEKDEHNLVEAISLAIITVTLNLGLLYNWPNMPPWATTVLTATLIVITFGAVCMFAYFLYNPIKDQIKEKVEMVFSLLNDFMVAARNFGREEVKELQIQMEEQSDSDDDHGIELEQLEEGKFPSGRGDGGGGSGGGDLALRPTGTDKKAIVVTPAASKMTRDRMGAVAAPNSRVEADGDFDELEDREAKARRKRKDKQQKKLEDEDEEGDRPMDAANSQTSFFSHL